MSAKSNHIKDVSKEVPEAISGDGLSWEFPPVQSNLKSGKTRSWQFVVQVMKGPTPQPIKNEWFIIGSQLPPDYRAVTFVRTKQSDSPKFDLRETTEITSGKNIGKANETNPFTQALRDGLGKYNKHVKSSMITTGDNEAAANPADAANAANAANPANAANAALVRAPRYKPMLVKNIEDKPLTDEDFASKTIYIQRK